MTGNNFQIDSAAVSDRGLSKKRPQNEDSFLEMPERGLFAVADGVGGAQAGEVASRMAVEILSEAFADWRENGDAEETMRAAIERANGSIYEKSHGSQQFATMATTVVALHVAGNIATIGHVGDSRLYRLDARGNLSRETGDHSVVEEEVRAGRMTAAQAANHPSRNVISRALGADSTVEVDLKTMMFEPRTTFLLCSDGITRHIDDAQLRELLLSGDAPAEITRKMKEICYERGAEDNLTAVIARVNETVVRLSAPVGETIIKPSAPVKALPTRELEEPTVASARPAPSSSKNPAALKTSGEEIPTGELPPFVPGEFTPRKIVVPETVAAAPPIEKREPVVIIEKTETPPPVVVLAEEKIEPAPPAAVGGRGTGKLLGKILSGVMWLILGGILGAGLYYLFLQNNKMPAAPVSTSAQTTENEYAAFENKRREVDKNPRRFIETNAAPPETAEAAYLLGRAFLLDRRFADAQQMFSQAKGRLPQSSDSSREVVADDIEIGLAIAGVAAAQQQFKKAATLNDTNGGQTNTGANTETKATTEPAVNR